MSPPLMPCRGRYRSLPLQRLKLDAALPFMRPPLHHPNAPSQPLGGFMRALGLSACLLLSVVATFLTQKTPAAQPAGLHWGPAPAVFPKGAKMAVVSGDPSKAAPFTVELAMPGGYKIPPHFHPTDEKVEVKKGTLLVGMGDTFDASKAKPMKAGDTGSVPANAHHFAAAKGATVIAVSTTGTSGLTRLVPMCGVPCRAASPCPLKRFFVSCRF